MRAGSEELGTIVKPPPVGDKIAIAGRVWAVDEVDHQKREVWCTLVKGNIPAYFGDVAGDIHTRILERMYQVLREDKSYPYLRKQAQGRLADARRSFGGSGHGGQAPDPPGGGTCGPCSPGWGATPFWPWSGFLKLRCGKRLGPAGHEPLPPLLPAVHHAGGGGGVLSTASWGRRLQWTSIPWSCCTPKRCLCSRSTTSSCPRSWCAKASPGGVLDLAGMKERVLNWSRLPALPPCPPCGNRKSREKSPLAAAGAFFAYGSLPAGRSGGRREAFCV